MFRGFFYKFTTSFKNLKNVIFHVKLLSLTLKDTLDSFFHDIFVFMEGQGRGLTDYFSIAREYSVFAVYS